MTTLNFFSNTSPHGQRLTSLRRRFSMSPVGYDALLFGISSLFALVVAFESKIPLYRQWGQMALGVYVAATLAALGLILVSRRRSVQALRGWLTALVVVGTVLIPLSFEVHWRFSVTPQSLHVQPEVVVIENAANFLAHGHDPYQAIVVNGTLQGGSPGLPAYESFFPYLPAMTLFGLPAATPLPKEATDARLYFVFGTLLAVVLALWHAPTSNNRRLRAFQVAIALPWAALTMVTGGDDLPIIGFLLAGMVLAQRRRPGWSGIVFGVACAMKFTAWPVALLALFAARDATGKRRPWLLALGAGVIVVPCVVGGLIWNPQTFIANVVQFPLGLAGIESPAGSALPGHILVTAFPWIRQLFVGVCSVAGALAILWYLWKRPPQDAAKVCQVSATVLLVAILLAPSTRIGYLLYPLNLFVWSWMLTPVSEETLAPL